MKRLLTILCLICFAQASYAALDRNYFEYDLTPSGAYSEEDANVKTETKTITEDGGQVKTKIERKRKRGFRGTGASQSNTYWDFGRPNYGYTGDVQ